MCIDFNDDRWTRLATDSEKWWCGDLDRPLIELRVANRDPGRPRPDAPLLSQATCTDLAVSVEDLVDRIDWELSRYTYYADSFPFVNLDAFGPGIMAAFCGAIVDDSTGQIWFHPAQPDIPITDLHLEYDPGNIWLNRIKEFCRAAMDRWQGRVMVGMPDLGGNLDIIQTFLPGERLIMELCDEPDEVTRLVWEEHDLWRRFYDEISDVLQPVNPGYSDWSYIYSKSPSYILQCDFSYMIGPSMFAQFVLPELKASIRRLSHTIYHLDGVGQLAHLDMLLGIPELGAIQWVPGDGRPGQDEWPDLRRKIAASGKGTQTGGSLETLQTIIDQAGSGRGIHHRAAAPQGATDSDIRRVLATFGAE